MKTNVAVKRDPIRTHEGGRAVHINAEKQLRRTVMACLLWEDQFYEDGQTIADRISELVPKVAPSTVASLAIEAREKMKLRHVPLLLVREMAKHGSIAPGSHASYVSETLERVIQRADELAEFLALYWKDGKQPISHQVRAGLDLAIRKFDEYSFAKYDRRGIVKLRDVLRIVRPLPDNEEQSALWKKVVKQELESPDTWEVELSRNDGVDKKTKWERLINENRLGALATLKNLRNMKIAMVDDELIEGAVRRMSTYRVLPFRFIAAARAVGYFEPVLEEKFFEVAGDKKLPGKTVILVDVSDSMNAPLSDKSDMKRMDAACGVAMVAREMCERVQIFTFSDQLVSVPTRRGFALRDAVVQSQYHRGTYLGAALESLKKETKYDRLIVITDEQSHDQADNPDGVGYMINVASYQNGIGYGNWTHIDGFSEAIFNYIVEIEQ